MTDYEKLVELSKNKDLISTPAYTTRYNFSKNHDNQIDGWKEVNDILEKYVAGLEHFDCFVNADSGMQVRYHYNWNVGTDEVRYIGVGYAKLEEFK